MPETSRDNPSISVLTPVLDEAEHLPAMLEAMRAQRGCGEIEFLLIDGGSSDATEQIVRDAARLDPRIRLLHNPERRTPNALNIGLAAARGEFVARMDAHTLYPGDYLANGVRRLEAGGAEWVSGPQLPLGRGAWSRRVALALSSPLGVGGAAFRSMPAGEMEVDSGFTGVWRKDRLDAIGGWDEGWPINQDGELAGRIRAAGGRIVCVPEMAASYVPRDSLEALARQYWRYGQYKAKTCGRHPASMRRSHLLPVGLVGVAAAATSRGRLGRAARIALALYGLAVGAATVRATPGERASDRAGVGAAIVSMHGAWGAGFLVGCLRFGPPLAAIARLLSPSRGD